MTAHLEFLADLHEAGISLSLAGSDLIAKPASRVTPQVAARIRDIKPRLVSILAGPLDPCPDCCGRAVRDQTFDRHWNRLCIGCWQWIRCLPPSQKESSQ